MSDPLLDVLLQSVPDRAKVEQSIKKDPAAVEAFLNHLRGLPLSAVPSEKKYLDTSTQDISHTLISLTQTSSQQFIEYSNVVSEFCTQFETFDRDVRQFASSALSSTLDEEVNQLERQTSVGHTSDPVNLLRNAEKVQDVLELPSLTLACVRNGYYSEALELASHARRLQARYANIRVVQDVCKEIESVMELMVVQLFKLLRQNVKLPVLIKAISYLRRMPLFANSNSSRQLQQLLLASRLKFIRDQVATIEPLRQSPEKYLKRYLEIFREQVFATIVGFRQIFPEDRDADFVGDKLTSDFLRTVVDELSKTIEEHSPAITDQDTRNSLWLQLAYCSQSLGRVGGDFWPSIQYKTSAIRPEEWQDALDKQREISTRLKG